jgi:hypothetical protein
MESLSERLVGIGRHVKKMPAKSSGEKLYRAAEISDEFHAHAIAIGRFRRSQNSRRVVGRHDPLRQLTLQQFAAVLRDAKL